MGTLNRCTNNTTPRHVIFFFHNVVSRLVTISPELYLSWVKVQDAFGACWNVWVMFKTAWHPIIFFSLFPANSQHDNRHWTPQLTYCTCNANCMKNSRFCVVFGWKQWRSWVVRRATFSGPVSSSPVFILFPYLLSFRVRHLLDPLFIIRSIFLNRIIYD